MGRNRGEQLTTEEAIKWFQESPFYHKEHEPFNMAIKALEQYPILDKIRDEIERKAHSGQWSDATMYGMLKAVAIIDKYNALLKAVAIIDKYRGGEI